jgi:RNA polymerase sigma-70 factor, ECF subfamily
MMRDVTLADVERLVAFDEADRTFQMGEEEFRAFYDQTARPIWLYIARTTGEDRLADDLLQETYYRFLRARVSFDSEDHRRHYLFRIATNLVRDHRRRPRLDSLNPAREAALEARPDSDADASAARSIDLTRAMEKLKPRERSLLWLAYAQGCTHEEIAASLGLKTASLKALLFRARRRLAVLLGPAGAREERS